MKTRLNHWLNKLAAKDLSSLLFKIAKIEEFKGWWKGTTSLNPQALGRLKKSIVVTSAGASTRIEGSQLADKDVERLLKGLHVSKLKDRDSQEVAGYAEVIQEVFDSYRNIPFSEGLILQFHGMLLRYSEKDKNRSARYKSMPNRVVAFDKKGDQTILIDPTPPHLTSAEMRELVEWTREQLRSEEFHPVLIIALFILEFLAIHPFHDGNGRLSRVLTNLLLAQAGYIYIPYASLEKIIEDHKVEYYLALRNGQKGLKSESSDASQWLHFFVDCMLKQIEVLKGFLEGVANKEELLSENQQRVMKLFERYGEITTRLVAEKLKIPSVTAKQILGRLVILKLIQRMGAGRSVRYRRVVEKGDMER